MPAVVEDVASALLKGFLLQHVPSLHGTAGSLCATVVYCVHGTFYVCCAFQKLQFPGTSPFTSTMVKAVTKTVCELCL